MAYKPPERFDCYCEIFKPEYQKYNGVAKPVYPETGVGIMCKCRSFGGTETTVNGVYSIENTAIIDTWYNPIITAGCRVKIDGKMYEILGEPENIENRRQFMKFKVKRVAGFVN